MNEKIRKEISELEKQTMKVNEDATNIIASQLDELAKVRTISKAPELKRVLLEEADYLEDASAYFFDMYKKSSKTANEIKTQVKEFSQYESHTKKKFIPNTKPNAIIDYEEKITQHFARGNTFYKLFWVFFIGCFAGVVIETIYCLIQNGHFESRVGLIYGPFNLVYGVGALLMHLFLYKYRNRSKWYAFLGGFIAGTIVEYLCSFVQEMLFGSTSWDYSDYFLNINGRVCLLYSVFWGFLGIAWIKWIYPYVAQWILKIPNKFGKGLTIALCAFMVFNSIMTLLVVNRWQERYVDKQPPSNVFEEYVDEHYPDERMKKILPNFTFKEKDA